MEKGRTTVENAIGVIVSGMLILLPFLLIALDIIFAVKKKERPIFEMIAFFIGSIYMILAYALWELPDYKTPLNAWKAQIRMSTKKLSAYTRKQGKVCSGRRRTEALPQTVRR